MLGAVPAWSMSVSPSPSYNGSYTVSWGFSFNTAQFRLQEKVPGGSYITGNPPNGATSKSYSGKTEGTYFYRIQQKDAETGLWLLYELTTVDVSVPNTPSGLDISGTNPNCTGNYTVSWNAATGASTYRLQERINGTGLATVQNTSARQEAFSNKGAATYEYRVRAENPVGNSAFTAFVSVDVMVPPTPGNIHFDVSSPSYTGNYTVSWNTATCATTYRLQERVDGGSWTTVQNTSATHKTYSGKAAGTYDYRVRAEDGVGNSSYSQTITMVVSEPPTPTGLAISGTDPNCAGTYTVSWNTATGASTYRLQESTDGGNNWTTLQNTSATQKAFSGVTAGGYSYRVRAENPVGNSSWANSVAVTVQVPDVPGGFQFDGGSPNYTGTYTVNWNASTCATTYHLQESTDGGNNWTDVQNTAALYKDFTGLSVGTYLYQLRAENAVGNSAYTATISMVVAVPEVPATLTAPATDTDGAYDVSWSAVTGAASYVLNEQEGTGSWVQVYAGPLTSYTVTGNGDGTWNYEVQACNNPGCSAFSATASVIVATVPGDPGSLDVTPATSTDGNLTASWTAATGSVTAYELEDSIDGAGFTNIYTGVALTDAPNGAADGVHSLRVRACNTVGTFTSCSNYVSGPDVIIAHPPSEPDSITVVPEQSPDGNLSISWPASTGTVTTYQLRQRVDGGSYSLIYNGLALSQDLSSLADGTYTFKIRACNKISTFNSCSAQRTSNDIYVAHPPGPAGSIDAQPALSHDGSQTVSWTAATGTVTSYELERKIDAGSYANVYTGAALTQAFSSLGDGVYSYRVRACNTVGNYTNCGNWVTAADVTVQLNQPPDAVDDAATGDEDTQSVIDVLANDSDPDQDPLTITDVTQGTHGSITNNGSDVTYTPEPDWNGQDTFTYTISDGHGESDTATVTVTVNAVNDAPVNTVPGPASFVTSWTETLNGLSVSDADAGTNPVSVTLSIDLGATLTLSGTTGLTFTTGDGNADANMEFSGSLVDINAALAGLQVITGTQTGNATLTLTVNDQGNTGSGGAGSDSDTVSISVSVNQAPVIASVPVVRATTGQAYYYQVIATDANNHALSYQLLAAPSGMSVDGSGLITWPSPSGLSSQQQVIVEVDDNHGGTFTQTFYICE